MSSLPPETPAIPRPQSAVAAALARHARHARGAHSANTERALRTDTAVFAAWCIEREVPALPASPDTVAKFIDAQAAAKSPATVRRYVATIAALHRAAAMPEPTKAEIVRLALKRLHRAKGRRQQQAHGLTFTFRSRLLDAAGERRIDLRNRALLAVAYDTGCRRSELVAMKVSDMRSADDGSGTLLIRRGKTDPEGIGAVRYLAPDTMEFLKAWLATAAITEGPIFVALSRGGRILGPLGGDRPDAGAEVARIFKRMAQAAGVKPQVIKALSGHSTRIGLAQDLAAAGEDLPAIMQAGGWKTPAMVARYVEHTAVRRGAVARLAEKQKR